VLFLYIFPSVFLKKKKKKIIIECVGKFNDRFINLLYENGQKNILENENRHFSKKYYPFSPTMVSLLGSVWVCDFKKCELKIAILNVRFKKVIFKNVIKRLVKSQFCL